MATQLAASPPEQASAAPVKVETGRGTLLAWLGMPVFLAILWGGTYFWVSTMQLDSIEQRYLNQRFLTQATVEHLQLTAVSTLIVIGIAIPLGIILTRRFARAAVPVVLAVANIGQGVPSVGLITLFVLTTGNFGFWPVVIGLVAYSALPILRNTMVGLEQVDSSLLKASRGMGMSPFKVLLSVELPLAVPVMIAGIRTALIINVGTATLATFFGAGGLGGAIFGGFQLDRDPVLIVGVVMASGLALLIDYVAGSAGRLLSPRGL